MLNMYEPNELVTIASNSNLTGLSQATSHFSQIAVGRQCFDDTKVKYSKPKPAALFFSNI